MQVFDSLLLEHIGIPKVHWAASINKIPDRCQHKKYIQSYLESIMSNVESGSGLYLWGDFGRGKSAIAAICLKRLAKFSIFGFWIKAKEIPRHLIKETVFDEGQTVIERAETCPLLIIDELQIRYSETKFTEWSAEDLIRTRVDAKLSTIITTNLAPPVIERDYPALYSVVLEAFFPIKVQGYDFRKVKAGKNGYDEVV